MELENNASESCKHTLKYSLEEIYEELSLSDVVTNPSEPYIIHFSGISIGLRLTMSLALPKTSITIDATCTVLE
jgi:hypothetical protein